VRYDNVISFNDALRRREAMSQDGWERARKRRNAAAQARIRRREGPIAPPSFPPPGNRAA
jgi:hypothetical protein